MNLDEEQKKLFAPLKSNSVEEIAAGESMGLSAAFAEISEKIEVTNYLLIPGLTSTGRVAGEIRDMYRGKGKVSEEITVMMSNVIQSISQLAAILEIPMSRVVAGAYERSESGEEKATDES